MHLSLVCAFPKSIAASTAACGHPAQLLHVGVFDGKLNLPPISINLII